MNQQEYNRRKYEKAKATYDLFIKVYDFQLDDLLDEVWLPIPDYEGLYEGSNYGRTKSFHKGKTIILKPALSGDGYLCVCLSKGGNHKTFKVSRLVATLFIPNPDNKPEVNHIYSRFSNHVDCLEWATSSENEKHAYNAGLKVARQGEDNEQAKMTNEQVVYIRENPDGLNTVELADKFGIDQTTISDIQLGKKYKNAGGTIRGKIDTRIPDEIREQIRADYQKGVRGYGCHTLAKKYGVNHQTIWSIIHETD